ncbi:MAG TPA: amidohydrolase family protein [Xanthomonadaceae bacterium]|nr:amidohydrolase family protein [Xanthomonadaceae bacterium]
MFPRFLVPVLLVALVIAFFLALPEPRAPQPPDWPAQTGNSFVLRGAQVFDGERLHRNRDVLVQDGRIAAVGPKVPAPAGTPEFSAEGHTLLPAFIDAHTHNFGDARSDALRFGVATQIDLFTAVDSLAAARVERESLERTDQADLWSAGTLLTVARGHGTQFGLPIPTLDDATQADAFVAARIAEGSDFIKLVLEPGRSFGSTMPTLDAATVKSAIEAAHARGKLALVHVSTAVDARTAIEAGGDGLAHLFADTLADADLLALAREREVFVIPTLAVLESVAGRAHGLDDDPRILSHLSPVQRESLARQFPGNGVRAKLIERALGNARALHEAGVTLLAGSDAPNPGTAHGASLHRELELLVEAGLTPAQALAAATAHPAKRFALADRGRITSAMRADLVLVEGDPLADIRATRAIAAVWKNGYRVARLRFDGTAADQAAPLTEPVLGRFDEGDDGWMPTTDRIRGGTSDVAMVVSGGRLAIDADVRAGSMWPWAGAMRMLGTAPMEPVDARDHATLHVRLRASGPVQVLFFSGASAAGVPASWPITDVADWTEVSIPLAAVEGFDAARARALAIVAGPQPGTVRIEVDSIELRGPE